MSLIRMTNGTARLDSALLICYSTGDESPKLIAARFNSISERLRQKSKEFTYNYVDRVRLAENSLQDHKCPGRTSGWRNSRSVSHLDLATSCPSAASGVGHHWPNSRQLCHSRSLDYNHLDRCNESLDDIAEFYWRIDPDAEFYEDEEHAHPSTDQKPNLTKHNEGHHCKRYNYSDDNYHSADSIYQPPQQRSKQQQLHGGAGAAPLKPLEYDIEACSLRRSRSLAVIREETFSDLQITSANSNRRRSQLIPRARLVNRGFFPERDRSICSNEKHHHHHNYGLTQEQHAANSSIEQDIQSSGSGDGNTACPAQQQHHYSRQHFQNRSNRSHSHNHSTYSIHHSRQEDPHSQQLKPYDTETTTAAATAPPATPTATRTGKDDFYVNLKRLDALATDLGDHLHPWHNDRSDLESLNSDYFKNSLHQSHEFKQQLDFETLEQAVSLLTATSAEKPRLYKSRRQPLRSHIADRLSNTRYNNRTDRALAEGDSCPENSQSSAFPETTTSNSDDQTDSPSLSEQEYDITKIEEIFQKTRLEGDDESYELISLTTTRTRIETTEDEDNNDDKCAAEASEGNQAFNIHARSNNRNSGGDTGAEAESESTFKRARAVSDNLQKLIAYDSVYLSSEEGSDGTLVDDSCDSYDQTHILAGFEHSTPCDTSTLLHISIEDTIYEPHGRDQYSDFESSSQRGIHGGQASTERTGKGKHEIKSEASENAQQQRSKAPTESEIYTQVLKAEYTPQAKESPNKILSSNSNPNPDPNPSSNLNFSSAPTLASTTSSVASASVTSSVASKSKILSAVDKRKLKPHTFDRPSHSSSHSTDTATPSTGIFENLTQYGVSAHNCQPHPNYSSASPHNPFAHLKRQATDSLYLPYITKANLGENQYHSLPDVNIGQSLKVSECIDAELRSSYNYNRYQCADINYSQRTSAASGVSSKKHKHCEESVTKEEIYDSIKRFGRAHQKARQREYQKLLKENIAEQQDKQSQADEHHTRIPHKVATKTSSSKETELLASTKAKSSNLDSPKETVSTTSVVKACNVEPAPIDGTASIAPEASIPQEKLDTQTYEEQPKEAPGIEVAYFSKQIQQRAKQIRDSSKNKSNLSPLQQADNTLRPPPTLPITPAISRADKSDIKRLGASSDPNQFRIIVTDTQNNIIEEDSIDGNRGESTSEADIEPDSVNESIDKVLKFTPPVKEALTKPRETVSRRKSAPYATYQNRLNCGGSSLKRVPSKTRRQSQQQQPLQPRQLKSDGTATQLQQQQTHDDFCLKSKEHRVLGSQIYKARPIRVLSTNDSFRRATNGKMSRPQILHVVENKCKSDLFASEAAVRESENKKLESEYLKKVDAVRSYWSKLAKDDHEAAQHDSSKPQSPESSQIEDYAQLSSNGNKTPVTPELARQEDNQNVPHKQPERRHFILGAHEDRAAKIKKSQSTANPTTVQEPKEFCSFIPSIEIFELDGEKKATIVSAVPIHLEEPNNQLSNKTNGEPQFDHIRYKVLKSQQLLRANMTPRTKKEAQFDGLIQYLQDYSFQELLSNNNVVIVEPVRTKIEAPPVTKSTPQRVTCAFPRKSNVAQARQGNSSVTLDPTSTRDRSKHYTNSGGIRRHFFYQPVRVNRELYEEELPTPDTVRNVRKFFEEHILPRTGEGILVRNSRSNDVINNNHNNDNDDELNTKTTQLNGRKFDPKLRRERKYRYLTIDTSYGHTLRHKQPQTGAQARKWDTASLSSGISSGDLSSPCECNDAEAIISEAVAHKRNLDSTQPPELKGVHVQDAIKRHNSAKHNTEDVEPRSRKSVPGTDNGRARLQRTIYGLSGDSSYYRDIYECHIAQRHSEKATTHNGPMSKGAAAHANLYGDEDDGEYDGYEEDEDDLCKSHYVSNEVLEKIRECGSSVTYYGGRVLETNSPDPQRFGSPIPQHAGTVRRTQAREVETCKICQPNDCPQDRELQTALAQNEAEKMNTQAGKYAGVKFKLVKSNSCSSRLELAGASDENQESNRTRHSETEVVRRMVDRFESDSAMTLTINSQAPVRCCIEATSDQGDRRASSNNISNNKKVTVNNHINVPQQVAPDAERAMPPGVNSKTLDEKSEKHKTTGRNIEAKDIGPKPNDGVNAARKEILKKITTNADVCSSANVNPQHSDQPKNCKQRSPQGEDNNSAPHSQPTRTPHSTSDEAAGSNGIPNGTRKISRNKNVDLAFPMVRQQQKLPPSNIGYDAIGGAKCVSEALKTERISTKNTPPPKGAATPQITVSVQVHNAGDPTAQEDGDEVKQPSCLSATSSSASLIDMNVVRHYVANDKSLFQRRKYDDIEFEVFEVYDPSKDLERLNENNPPRYMDVDKDNDDNNDRDGGDDGNNNRQSKRATKPVPFPRDLSARNGVTADCDGKDDRAGRNEAGFTDTDEAASLKIIDTKSKADTDCYDSLDDKL